MAQLILGSSSTWRFRLLAQHFNPALLPDCMAIVTAQCAPEIDEKSFGHDLRKNHEQASQRKNNKLYSSYNFLNSISLYSLSPGRKCKM